MTSHRIKNKEDINLDGLIENINSLIKEVQSWDYHDDNDRPHWIQEAAINAVCEEWFWERFNKNT